MHLTSIRLSGWRSFSPQRPFEIKDLGRLNILLGPNGAGKSNLGRFTDWFREQLATVPGVPTVNFGGLESLLFKFHEVDSWAREGGPLDAVFGVEIGSLPDPVRSWAAATYTPATSLELRFQAARQGDSDRWLGKLVPHSIDGTPLFRLRGGGDNPNWDVHAGPGGLQALKGDVPDVPRSLARGLVESVLKSWLRIPALRHPDANTSLGAEVNAALLQLSQGDGRAKEWTILRNKLGAWMTRLLGEEVTVEVTGEGVRIISTTLELPILARDAGDGVAQLTYMLAKLWLEKHNPMLVFIDEPEAHLHPGATIDLLHILEVDFPWVQAIIATHSAAVVDALSPDWRLWRVLRGSDGASVVESVDAQPERIATLDALGVLPSQVFLARVVVWVEGPSDAIYYRRLLAEVDPALVFRRDYAFAIYGGSAGEHLSLEDEPEAVVDVLRLAHRNVLVYDAGAGGSAPSYVSLWDKALSDGALPGQTVPTPGREVENLVDCGVLGEVVAACVSEIRSGGRRLLVTVDPAVKIGARDSFAARLADSTVVAGEIEVSEAHRHAVQTQIERKKTTIARRVVESARDTVFSDDAREWGAQLAAAIKEYGRAKSRRRPPM